MIKPRGAGDLLLRPHVFLVRHKGAKQNKPLNIQVQSSDKVSIKNKPTMTIDTVFFLHKYSRASTGTEFQGLRIKHPLALTVMLCALFIFKHVH